MSTRAESCLHCGCPSETMIFGGQDSIEVVIRKDLDKPRGELTEADFEKVTELYLDAAFTLRCLKELVKLKQLTKLHLSNTPISDSGLKELVKLKQLTSLNLSGTPITDTGLKELAKCKLLARLFLFNTKVTKAGVARLKEALPDCKIEHNAKN